MGQRLKPGNEEFSGFLIQSVYGMMSLLELEKQALELYIAITYGDLKLPRIISYQVAKTYGFYPKEVKELIYNYVIFVPKNTNASYR